MNCMASTSPQSSSPLPSCLEKPLPLDGFQGTPDEVEQQWYDQVYLGSGDRMKQLTWRAVIVGMLLGSILSLTNLYANLKMGWSFGVALTAGIISFALWNAFVRLGISKSPMTILENTCMQSAASSAGYSTGGTLTSAVAALLLLTGQHMPLGTTFAWIFFIAVLGVTMAIPMKRQMINIEQIRFPDSIATAETLKVLYSEGKKAAGQAKALLYSALFAAANAIAMAAGGERWLGTVQQHILGNWYQRTIFFKWDLMFVGAGALVGMKTSLSLFIGGTVCWALYVPWLESQKLLPAGAGYRESVSWTATHPIELNERLTPVETDEGIEYIRHTYALPVTIEDGCWIGGGVIILPGITIGKGSVIGAGSVVTKNIPPDSLAAGNPCKVIRKINGSREQ